MTAARRRRVHLIKKELLLKSREAALSACQTFNNPLITFKSETFIVLIIIGWTYLLHAYYRQQKIEYRDFKQHGRRRHFEKTRHGAFKHWSLEQCLSNPASPLDRDTTNNLRFLIGLRHEIEHQMTLGLDNWLSGRYQACALNYNYYIKVLFGSIYGLDKQLTYSMQFMELTAKQIQGIETVEDVPPRLRAYMIKFDEQLTGEEFNSPRYAYRVLYTRKLVNRPGQADRAFEFVDPHSELAQQLEKQYWLTKEVERPKFRAKDIIIKMRAEGFVRFNQHHHTQLWKALDAKNPGKGYGWLIAGTWYWYESWLLVVRNHCEENTGLYQSSSVSTGTV